MSPLPVPHQMTSMKLYHETAMFFSFKTILSWLRERTWSYWGVFLSNLTYGPYVSDKPTITAHKMETEYEISFSEVHADSISIESKINTTGSRAGISLRVVRPLYRESECK